MHSSNTTRGKYKNVKSRLFDKPVSYIKKEEGARQQIQKMSRENMSSPKRFVAGGKFSTSGISGLVSPRQKPAYKSPKRYTAGSQLSPPRYRSEKTAPKKRESQKQASTSKPSSSYVPYKGRAPKSFAERLKRNNKTTVTQVKRTERVKAPTSMKGNTSQRRSRREREGETSETSEQPPSVSNIANSFSLQNAYSKVKEESKRYEE